MIFTSEKERMAHPQAGLIPLSYWEGVLRCGDDLIDYLFPLIQETDDELLAQIQEFSSKTTTAKKSKFAWLAIASSHPLLSAEALVSIGIAFNMSEAFLFQVVALHGHIDVLHSLEKKVTQERLQEMIRSNNYATVRNAAKNDHLR